MARSVWKGPFVELHLLKKAETAQDSGGRHPVTPWGKPTKGARTRNNKQTDKLIIRSRHAKKKR